MHIRQHNTDTGGTDHSCSICGKSLSSASSLDRHMLVHSGERPYKCSVCDQSFTTNGNMHRSKPQPANFLSVQKFIILILEKKGYSTSQMRGVGCQSDGKGREDYDGGDVESQPRLPT
uniref:Uncharacterized protein n=1 Tax=Sphaerodactylus townsendi TaxID=933632 RepID=A0ACB8FCQ7_9SAUR